MLFIIFWEHDTLTYRTRSLIHKNQIYPRRVRCIILYAYVNTDYIYSPFGRFCMNDDVGMTVICKVFFFFLTLNQTFDQHNSAISRRNISVEIYFLFIRWYQCLGSVAICIVYYNNNYVGKYIHMITLTYNYQYYKIMELSAPDEWGLVIG